MDGTTVFALIAVAALVSIRPRCSESLQRWWYLGSCSATSVFVSYTLMGAGVVIAGLDRMRYQAGRSSL